MRTTFDPKFDQPSQRNCHSMVDVGQVIRQRRKELGMNQTQLAKAVPCSQKLISEIERGRGTVAFDTVLRIANGLGIDLITSIRGK